MGDQMFQFPVTSLREQLQSACLLEALARKPGNVHPGASFADLTFEHFVKSAAAVAPVLSRTRELGVGPAILEAVRATTQTVGTNTNLGMILLLAPLAAVPAEEPLQMGIEPVLQSLTMHDAESLYAAIRLANPGGLGKVDDQDVSQPPTLSIVAAMTLAAQRDAVALQYSNGFQEVLNFGRPALLHWIQQGSSWEQAIIGTQLQLMALIPDSLIARKCGIETAVESQRRAQQLLDQGWPFARTSADQQRNFDAWLRSDGHRRNPGTTADLVAAILFAVIRDGDWTPPPQIGITASLPEKP
ncbi:triphosphoribosyl-dephospho-CoA synthase [Planctomicrobium sp. SH664]|uniref:triphosphoribosyl-dephospho-CoA synthase n=1 Tax=Planctomicrobium sp. SH664 TaxID=3448125 RepID=UPI003F5CB76A